jgi:endoglucanase
LSGGLDAPIDMFKFRLLQLPLLLLAWISEGRAQFAETDHKRIVDAAGKPLFLRATNLGNWLVPEGYMWLFEGGPQSPGEIRALVLELLGPEGAAFWQKYRGNYVTRGHRTPASRRLQRHSSSFALQPF